MKGTFRMTVTAPTSQDAVDIAGRRARDDGWRVLASIRCTETPDGRYAVVLAVERQRCGEPLRRGYVGEPCDRPKGHPGEHRSAYSIANARMMRTGAGLA